MKALFPEPKTIEQARRQANIVLRALDLFSDGYTYRAVPHHDLLYYVVTPEGKHYMVDLSVQIDRCECKSFEYDGDCKHRIGLAIRLSDEAWMEREAAAREAMADADEPLGIEKA